MSRRFDLVAFDVDGTLVHHPKDKTIWEVLNLRFTGSDDQNAERWEQYKRGTLSYRDWVALDIEGWRAAGATLRRSSSTRPACCFAVALGSCLGRYARVVAARSRSSRVRLRWRPQR